MPLRDKVLLSAILLCVTFPVPASATDEPTKQECVAANESAQDLTRAGKLRDAREELIACSARACPRAVRDDCAERLAAIEHAIPKVTFTLVVPKSDDAIDVRGATATLDGNALSGPIDSTAISVDPGEHTFIFTLLDWPPVSVQLSLHEGDRLEREVVFKAMAPVETHRETPAPVHTGATRVIGWSAVGTGAAGIVLGSVFGILAVGKKSSLDDGMCNAAKKCSASAQPDIDALHADAVAANISLAVGAVGLLAGGAILLFVPDGAGGNASREPKDTLHVDPWLGVGSLGMMGRFQ
jgi:hypothetical protein